MSPRIQNIIILLGFITLAAFAYYLLIVQGDGILTRTTNDPSAIESQLFLRQLNQLKEVSLDTSLFSEEAFRALVDQSESVSPQPVGRANPFTVRN